MAKDRAAIRLYERLGWQHIGTTTHVFDGSEETPAHCYVEMESRSRILDQMAAEAEETDLYDATAAPEDTR